MTWAWAFLSPRSQIPLLAGTSQPKFWCFFISLFSIESFFRQPVECINHAKHFQSRRHLFQCMIYWLHYVKNINIHKLSSEWQNCACKYHRLYIDKERCTQEWNAKKLKNPTDNDGLFSTVSQRWLPHLDGSKEWKKIWYSRGMVMLQNLLECFISLLILLLS